MNDTAVMPAAAPQLRRQGGFTLVELAIVLVIIGLIIGGVLKGQELIQSAKLRSTVQAASAIQSASQNFRDKYSALPGDFANAVAQIGVPAGIAWTAAANGDGDGILDGTGVTLETLYYFNHLAAANFITGVEIAVTPAAAAGQGMPAAPIGGAFTVENLNINGLVTNWLMLGTLAAGQAGVINGEQARTIDVKVDDGRPSTGSVRTNTNVCINAGDYQLATTAINCLIHMQL